MGSPGTYFDIQKRLLRFLPEPCLSADMEALCAGEDFLLPWHLKTTSFLNSKVVRDVLLATRAKKRGFKCAVVPKRAALGVPGTIFAF